MEGGSTSCYRCKIDASAVGLDDLLDDGQSEPGSLGFCRLEEAECPQVRRKAGARVRDDERSHGDAVELAAVKGPEPAEYSRKMLAVLLLTSWRV